MKTKLILTALSLAMICVLIPSGSAQSPAPSSITKPNIVIIWGDDIGHVHLDGYNMLPLFTGEAKKGPREEFFYLNDDGGLTALRYDNWKLIFEEQRAPGTLRVWAEPLTPLRVPLLFNLRTDPYERAQITSNTYYDWFLDHAFILVPAQQYVGKFLATFKEFPPSQKPATFNLDKVMEQLQAGATGSH